jgi:ABC-type glutathione transport system ATPase component
MLAETNNLMRDLPVQMPNERRGGGEEASRTGLLAAQQAPDPQIADPSEIIDLEARGLVRAIRGRVVVDNVSVDVQPAEILAIAGPSGAGKSSFLRLLNRLDEPTGGTVLLRKCD